MRGHLLFVDHRDSFSHILMDYFRQLDFELDWIQSEELADVDIEQYDLAVISPGFGIPKEKADTIRLIKKELNKIPFLGICLGHQLLALVQGGTLKRCEVPLHGKTTKLKWTDSTINTHHLPEIDIMHYHSWVVDEIPSASEVLAYCNKTSYIMGLAAKDRSYIGWQFHPESIGTQRGLELLDWSLQELLKKSHALK